MHGKERQKIKDSLTITEISSEVPSENIIIEEVDDSTDLVAKTSEKDQTSTIQSVEEDEKIQVTYEKKKTKSVKIRNTQESENIIKTEDESESEILLSKSVNLRYESSVPKLPETCFVDEFEGENINSFEYNTNEITRKLQAINTSENLSETIPTASTYEIKPNDTENIAHALSHIVPFISISQTEISPNEMESTEQPHVITHAKATERIKLSEHYKTTQSDDAICIEEFENNFKPRTTEINVILSSNESITVYQNEARDVVLDSTVKNKEASAVALLSQNNETIFVTEEIPMTMEGDLVINKKPKTSEAEISIPLNESLNIYEVQESISNLESTYTLKKDLVTPKFKLSEQESLLISEEFPQLKPEKYYPELIVPTEFATKGFVTQTNVLQQKVIASEKEGECEVDKIPSKQNAFEDYQSPDFEIIISETQPQEYTKEYDKSLELNQTVATFDFALSESCNVQIIESGEKEKYLLDEGVDTKNANIDFLEHISVISIQSRTMESETKYDGTSKPTMFSADKIVVENEVPTITSYICSESESNLAQSKAPVSASAHRSMDTEMALSVTNIDGLNTVSNLDKLNFITEKASKNISSLDINETMQIQMFEKEDYVQAETTKEKTIIKQNLTAALPTSLQSEVFVEENSRNIHDHYTPENQEVTLATTDALKAIQILENSSNESPGILAHFAPQSAQAKEEQSFRTESVIEEAVVGEGFTKLKQTEITKHNAEVALDQLEEICISEVLTEDREERCLSPEKPKTYYPEKSYTHQQKLPIVSETISQTAEEPLALNITSFETANKKQSLVESLLVSLSEIIEKEKEYCQELSPESKEATLEMDEDESVIITQIILHDKEKEYIIEEIPQSKNANQSFPTLEIAIKTETYSEDTFKNIRSETSAITEAKVVQDSLKSVEVTEFSACEIENNMDDFVQPKPRFTNFEVATDESLQVLEVEGHDSELNMNETFPLNFSSATLGYDAHQIASTETTCVDIGLENLKRESPIKDVAEILTDVLPCPNVTQVLTSEYESHQENFIMPSAKYSAINFEDIKTSIPCVNEYAINEKENEFTKLDIPCKNALPSLDTNRVASTTEVISNSNYDILLTSTPAKQEATRDITSCQQLIQSEVNANEVEEELKNKENLQECIANPQYQPGVGTIVTTICSGEKEGIFPDIVLPSEQNAEQYVTDLKDIAISSEIRVQNSCKKFSKEETASQAEANINVISMNSVSSSQINIFESNFDLEKMSYDGKQITTSFTPFFELSVSEEIPEEKEGSYTKKLSNESKSANMLITEGTELPQQEENTELQSIKELQIEDLLQQKKPNLIQDTFNQLIVQQPICNESEIQLDAEKKPNETKAAWNINENKMRPTIHESLVNDFESTLLPLKIEEEYADTKIISQQAPIVHQVDENENLNILSHAVNIQLKAKSSQIPNVTSMQTLTTAEEKEGLFSVPENRSRVTADQNVEMHKSLIVKSVTSEEFEQPLNVNGSIVFQNASSDFTLLNVAESSNIVPNSSLKSLEIPEIELTSISTKNTMYDHIFSKETFVSDSEANLPEQSTRNVQLANVNYSPQTAINTMETNVVDTARNIDKTDVDTFNAQPGVTEFKSVLASEILPEVMPFSISEKDMKSTAYAEMKETEYQRSINVEECFPNEVEERWSSSSALKCNANLEFVQKSSLSISKTNAEDITEEMKVYKLPSTRKADLTIDQHNESIQSVETLVDQDITTVAANIPQAVQANKFLVENITVNVEETLTNEFGDNLKCMKSTEVAARQNIEHYHTPLLVKEIYESEREGVVEETINECANANVGFKGSRAAQVTEITTDDNTGELTFEKNIHSQAIPKHIECQSLINEQQTIIEVDVSDLQTTDFIDHKADVTKSSAINVPLNVQEIFTEERTKEESVTVPQFTKAQQNYIPNIAKEGNVPCDFESHGAMHENEKLIKQNALEKVSYLESIQCSENENMEKEDHLKHECDFELRSGTLSFVSNSSLDVSQVDINESLSNRPSDLDNCPKIANTMWMPNEIAIKSEVSAEQSIADIQNEKVNFCTGKEETTPNILIPIEIYNTQTLDAPETSLNVAKSKECYPTSESCELSSAITVTEVECTQNEEHILENRNLDSKTASVSIDVIPVAQKEITKSEENTDMLIVAADDKRFAKSLNDIENMRVCDVLQTTPCDKEMYLNATELDASKIGNVVYEELKPISVTEITENEIEGDINDKTTLQCETAITTLSELKTVEQMETQTFLDVRKMPDYIANDALQCPVGQAHLFAVANNRAVTICDLEDSLELPTQRKLHCEERTEQIVEIPLTVTETIQYDLEIDSTDIPVDHLTAIKNIAETYPTLVSEVYPESSTEILLTSENIRDSKLASVSNLLSKSLNVSDTTKYETLGPLKICTEDKLGIVDSSIQPKSAYSASETIAIEREEDIPSSRSEIRNAHVEFEEYNCPTREEVHTELCVVGQEAKSEIAPAQKAVLKNIECQPISISEDFAMECEQP
ncbi:hypothetical protein B566_EDAN004267, partial [Ephemera danica]